MRELEHAIERAVILSTGTMLTPDDFMLRSPRSSNTVSEKDKYNLERMEKDAINEVMRMCGGNITLAKCWESQELHFIEGLKSSDYEKTNLGKNATLAHYRITDMLPHYGLAGCAWVLL